jgi:hypothetical protein
MPIGERFRLIHDATWRREAHRARRSLETLAAVAATLPTALVTRLARQQAQNRRLRDVQRARRADAALRRRAQLLENYPVGPLAGWRST